MKLSEAMRKGCEMVPRQSIGAYNISQDGEVSVCAITAMAIGHYGPPMDGEDWMDMVYKGHDLLKAAGLDSRAVYRRNDGRMADGRQWSREQIADWLEAQGL